MISMRAGVAINLVAVIAKIDQVDNITIDELSKETDYSVSYIEQIIGILRKHGLVVGIRGPGGGYRMAERTVTVRDVIDAIDREDTKRSRSIKYLRELALSEFGEIEMQKVPL